MDDGSGYTANIAIADVAGNTASSNTDTFGVDTTAPAASIDSQPADNNNNNDDATFTFSEMQITKMTILGQLIQT